MNKKKYINDTTKTLFQTLSNMGVTYEDEDLTFSIIENHITKVVEDLNISNVGESTYPKEFIHLTKGNYLDKDGSIKKAQEMTDNNGKKYYMVAKEVLYSR